MIILYIFPALLGLAVILTAVEFAVLLSQKSAQESPDKADADKYSLNVDGKNFEALYLFLSGEKTNPSFTEDEVYALLFKQSEYMRKRFDCADFRAQMLFKIYKDCGDRLSDRCKELIKKAFLDFKYFMDEPGDDSMCYWSENHLLLFAVSEYLAGQEWPNEIFSNNGMNGKEHMQRQKSELMHGWNSVSISDFLNISATITLPKIFHRWQITLLIQRTKNPLSR